MKSSKKLTFIDLFAGAGGMTLGFRMAGFEPVLAVEREADFAATYAENFGNHVLVGEIGELISAGKVNRKADVVIGGPPCQGFSNLTGNRASDPRRALWRCFMDVVESSQCRAFVLENVPNFITSSEGKSAIREARRLGFFVTEESVGILKASDYGVPQNRKRAIIMGSRLGPVVLPAPNSRRVTVREAFRGIPLEPTRAALDRLPAGGKDLHLARNPTPISLKRYKLIPPGGN